MQQYIQCVQKHKLDILEIKRLIEVKFHICIRMGKGNRFKNAQIDGINDQAQCSNYTIKLVLMNN